MVDADVKLCRLVRHYLEPFGFAVAVAYTGTEGLHRALAEPFQAVILDLMLPGLDGCELLRRLRLRSNVPVLVLTGHGGEPEKIVEMRADAYLPKTSSTRQVLAQLQTILHPRERHLTSNRAIVVGELSLDVAVRSAALEGRLIALTRVEFDLLAELARNRGRVQTHEQLLVAAGAGSSHDSADESIDRLVASLRRKLGTDPCTQPHIDTVPGSGYVMRWEERI